MNLIYRMIRYNTAAVKKWKKLLVVLFIVLINTSTSYDRIVLNTIIFYLEVAINFARSSSMSVINDSNEGDVARDPSILINKTFNFWFGNSRTKQSIYQCPKTAQIQVERFLHGHLWPQNFPNNWKKDKLTLRVMIAKFGLSYVNDGGLS